MVLDWKYRHLNKARRQLRLQEVHGVKGFQKCIHVECVIGLLKNKYSILQHTLPVLVKYKHDTDFSNIDKILIVCSALVNPVLLLFLINHCQMTNVIYMLTIDLLGCI